MEARVGFFGKLPSVGDFVRRGLPADFVEPWDRWLQAAMLGGRGALGADWARHYRQMAPWRFLLAPGGAGAAAWIGVALPSLDRVGRYFPLTLAHPVAGAVDPAASLEAAGAWLRALEQLGLDALDPALELDAWERHLRALGAPALVPAAPAGDATRPLRPAAPLAARLGPHGALGRVGAALAGFRSPALFVGGAPPTALACDGLPAAGLAAALFDGLWAERGWAGDAGRPDPAAAAPSDLTRPLSLAAQPNQRETYDNF